MLGTERIMMGSDMPFPIGDLEPMKIVAEAGLSDSEARRDQWRAGGEAVRIQ